MGYCLIPEPAKVDKSRVCLKKTNQSGNGIKTFQGSNKKRVKQSMLTGSISADTGIEFVDIGQIQLSEDHFVFLDNWQSTNMIVGPKERQKIHILNNYFR